MIPMASAYLLFYYLHQRISYLQRRLGCSSALHNRVWTSPLTFCSITQPDSNERPEAILLPFSAPKWAPWIMPKVSALLLWTIMSWSALCRNSFHLHHLNTCTCIDIFTCTLRGAVAFLFVCFLLPSHLELLSQAFCKVVSFCASHLGLSNFVTEIVHD